MADGTTQTAISRNVILKPIENDIYNSITINDIMCLSQLDDDLISLVNENGLENL